LAEQLKVANKREGLQDAYQVLKGEQTGACAVVITGHHRLVDFHSNLDTAKLIAAYQVIMHNPSRR
jgi:hypothetical protein